MAPDPEPLCFADAAAWRTWLDANEDVSDGVWLLLAKKGTVTPTSLSYAQALDEALCSGWIDGQRKSHDEVTFRQRYTPRRPRSIWSQRNVEHVARLIDEGRMRERGHAEIEKAQADGRWERAYAGQAAAEVPADLAAALQARPGARERFDSLTSAERYSILHPLMIATSDAGRQRRIERTVDDLTRGD